MDFADKRKAAMESGGQLVNPSNRGVGFVKWETEGMYVEGVYVDSWEAKAGRIVNIRVHEIKATVTAKNGDGTVRSITAQPGDIVYIGAHTADLRGKFPDELKGHTLLIGFIGNKPVKQGLMMLFDIVDRGVKNNEDEENHDDEDLPF